MAEKVTLMRLKVDLQCSSCYKKVKKILCKFPQIRDQVYDEQQNLVKITVVCCSPEKIRDKLCSKAGKVIKSIEIMEPPPPKPKQPEKPKEPEKKPEVVVVEKPKEPEKPKPPPEKPKEAPKSDLPKKPAPAPEQIPVPAGAYPYPPVPVGYCCDPCSEGHGWGPCHYGYGRPVPPPPCYDNYGYGYGYEYGYGYSYGKGCYVSRCDYFNEENARGCTIM
ncbi:hypothetical protein ACH5RR_017421 [Cinchona calisaya]|uniref:Uncharacterized protein n=1 Tax=Cinchona calisaya TaxID=153742 RepID=A0ABD2ZMB9_9GENT